LLHYPGKSAKKALISVRQVDIQNGYVPLEFALEKTFALYDKKLICRAMDLEDLGIHHRKENRSKYWLEHSQIIEHRQAFTFEEQFQKKALENPAEFSMFYLVRLINYNISVFIIFFLLSQQTTPFPTKLS
jgi:hypothetical protein